MKILRSNAEAASLATPLLVVLVADRGGTPPVLELLAASAPCKSWLRPYRPPAM